MFSCKITRGGDFFPGASPRIPRWPPKRSPKWLQYTDNNVFLFKGNRRTFLLLKYTFLWTHNLTLLFKHSFMQSFYERNQNGGQTHEILSKNKVFWQKHVYIPLKPTFLRDSGFFFHLLVVQYIKLQNQSKRNYPPGWVTS